MAWSGGYYYRSIRVKGKPRRQYVGSGLPGRLAAEVDALRRQQRKAEQARLDDLLLEVEWHDEDVAAIGRLADLLARAALISAGLHQHHRGEWRRKRGPG